MSTLEKLERVSLEIFGGCNYNCKMCPQSTGRGSDFTKKMPIDLFESILDDITPKYGHPVINLQGSGEPSIVKDLPKYIEACSKRGLKSYMYTNGSHFSGSRMKDSIDAGLSYVRFSCIGYDRDTYKEWMSKDNFDLIRSNAIDVKQYIKESKSSCELSSYHLVIDGNNTEYEIDQYRKNFINFVGTTGYIWKMHNWSGNYAPQYFFRKPDDTTTQKKRTCGRPFAPELTVRAGGVDGQRAAVTPCCMTLGPPNESKSILGHLDSQSIEDVWYGEKYKNLRDLHAREEFDSIDYCKNCDFLIEDPEVLVWSNDEDSKINHIIGTNVHFDNYQQNQ